METFWTILSILAVITSLISLYVALLSVYGDALIRYLDSKSNWYTEQELKLLEQLEKEKSA